MLHHDHPDCPGTWLISERRPGLVCTRCEAECSALPAAVVAAMKENNLALMLAQLAREGGIMRELGERPKGRVSMWGSDFPLSSLDDA